ncbi:hypothetical protein [Terrabacter carboxydivorans]|uniref:Uncharacterized protein n=1 Tax=Terrabacter carboxydivorans TaxID=619730 RepID=A0ABP5ZHW0_9MICO
MTIEGLKAELASRRGFAARVVPPRGLRNFGGGILFVLVLVAVAVLFQRDRATMWPGLVAWALVGLALIAVGLLHERVRLRWIHAAYLERGWVTAQVPSGLVRESGDSTSWLRRDTAITSGEPDEHVDTVVLVGAPGVTPESLRSAAATVRERLVPLSKDDERELGHRLQTTVLYRDEDAARLLPVPRDIRLTMQTGSSDFVVAVAPREGSRRRRTRYYGIRGAGAAR